MQMKNLLIATTLIAAPLSASAEVVNIGSNGAESPDAGGEILASHWIRSDDPDLQPPVGFRNETMFIGTTGSTDFRGYLAFDLTQVTGDTINSATVSIWSEGATTFNANGATGGSASDATSIDLNLTAMGVDIFTTPTAIQIAGGSDTATYTNLVSNGDQYGAVIDTVTLNLDAIAVDTQVDFDVTAAIQAAIDANASQITFGLTAPDTLAIGARNFFAFGGRLRGVQGTEIGPNLEVDFVPEPSSLALLSLGGLMVLRRRRQA